MGRPKKQEPTARERIEDSFDTAQVGNEPPEEEKIQDKVEETSQEEEISQDLQSQEEKEIPKETPPQEKVEEIPFDLKEFASNKGVPLEELTSKSMQKVLRSQMESEKKMHDESQKRSQVEQEFQKLRNYIDWDRLKRDMYGQPTNQQGPKQVPPTQLDKEQFFQQFAEKGPQYLDECISQSPSTQKVVQQYLQNLWPQLVQNVSYRVKLDDIYEQFKDKYPHLQKHEEQVFKFMLLDIQKNPQKNLNTAMKDAAKEMQTEIDNWKEEGKKEAQTIHQEKKKDNLPPGDRGSKERMQETKPKGTDEEKPESVEDIINWRRKVQDRGKTKVGYQYKR